MLKHRTLPQHSEFEGIQTYSLELISGMPCKSYHSDIMHLMGDEYTYLIFSFRSRPISTRWDQLVNDHQQEADTSDASTALAPASESSPLINRIREQSRPTSPKQSFWKRFSISRL
ncbi:hypothetical protein TWF192_003724 [Orbilia oligospora]|nr:hypothetical protein TWF192_003724 [Orbilia oligospora]